MLGRRTPPNPSKTHAGLSRTEIPAGIAHQLAEDSSGRILRHPLSWWRTRPADSFRRVDVAIARNMLARTAIIGETHWHLAAAGDAPTAIGVALRTLNRDGNATASLDVAMTAVLCIAIEGDSAAALLLSAALKRRSDSDQTLALADTWLMYQPRSWPTKIPAADRRCP
jgi:hypothetical protein